MNVKFFIILFLFSDFLQPLIEDENDPWADFDNQIKTEYHEYSTYGKTNENKLSFGSNPLHQYSSYNTWLNDEKEKMKNNPDTSSMSKSTKLIGHIIQKMNWINTQISNAAVFKFPKPIAERRFTQKKKKRSCKIDGKLHTCFVCLYNFPNGQSLGGHMSKKHPDSSLKYKMKKTLRDKNQHKRDVRTYAKKEFLKKYYNIDYDSFIQSTGGAKNIITMQKEKHREWQRVLKNCKKNYKIL